MSIEAMKQALEALELVLETDTKPKHEISKSITSLRQAIEQAEKQEFVAWRGYNWGHSPDDWVYRDFDDPILDGNGNNVGQPLYTTPPQRKPLPPQSPCEMTQAEGKMFKLGWLECEAAHGIKE